MSAQRTRRTGITIALALVAAACAAGRASAYVIDEWYVVMLDGQRAGSMHYLEESSSRAVVTINEIHLSVARGPATIDIEITSKFTETLDGEPFELVTTQALGADPITRTYRWLDDGSIRVTVEQQGESTIQTLDPIPGEWLTPAEARRVVATAMFEEAETFEYTMLDFLSGAETVHVTSERIGERRVELLGKTVPAVEIRSTLSSPPGMTTTEFIGEWGVPVKTTLSVGGLTFSVIRTEPELAQSDFEPAELLLKTFVTPSRAIADPRRLRAATYVLSVPDGTMPDPITTSVQRWERLDDARVRVVIDLDRPQPAPLESVRDTRSALSTAMISWRDEKIQEVGQRAIAGHEQAPPTERAELARRYVAAYVTDKSLDVGFASASEVCRTREGDCTEHATLLAAVLRTLGFRSRVVSGLIYAENFAGRSRIFGYHMWTQALIKDSANEYRWIDLDATLPADTPFDATHIALAASAMSNDESINSMAALAPLLGRLEIEVESAGPASP
ncbi:MAG: transglutaminase domain-containing protein [Planctomycetota bacterium]|nr:MAG: transglutaminase domain-containing protein [Planctomycetota bacterium]